jgi:integrase
VPITGLKRSMIVAALDKIEQQRGPIAADRDLAYLRSCLNWHAARSDDFVPPFARGMARTKPSERARDRVLTDDELRTVWRAAEKDGMFGAYVRMLLLTGQRRTEIAGLRRSEITGDVAVIPAERAKMKARLVVPLSAAALEIVNSMPSGDLLFPGRAGGSPVGAISYRLRRLIEKAGTAHWTLHDLRRTSRTLLTRAGVRPDIAERCLGHRLRGVVAVYDRHDYLPEMRRAFDLLATYIASIVGAEYQTL